MVDGVHVEDVARVTALMTPSTEVGIQAATVSRQSFMQSLDEDDGLSRAIDDVPLVYC